MTFLDFQTRRGLLIVVLSVFGATSLPYLQGVVSPLLDKQLGFEWLSIGTLFGVAAIWLAVLVYQKKN